MNTPVEIVNFTPVCKAAFQALNHEWITHYFELEELDNQILDHPETYILAPGGPLLMARCQQETVGTCALIKVSETVFELGKMAVTEKMRGLKIGQ
jgi:putative acetyltransferase